MFDILLQGNDTIDRNPFLVRFVVGVGLDRRNRGEEKDIDACRMQVDGLSIIFASRPARSFNIYGSLQHLRHPLSTHWLDTIVPYRTKLRIGSA